MLYAPGVGEVPISISGDPASPGVMTHTIRAVGATTRALCGLRNGDVLGWRGPYGRPWPLETVPSGADVVIVAGGIGLAPLRPAMLSLLGDRARYRRIALLYGARTPGELLFRHDLERWRSRLDTAVEITVDYGDAEWRGNVGVVTTLIAPARFDAARAVALVCGPEVMIRFTVADLRKRGVPPERIFLSLERNMHCGVGLCGRCQFGPQFICRDGPVFSYADVERFFVVREI
jgi:NAD(P)H-flavin reductase